nr:hypothetical protein CFP56_31700 [Quercus suber]
MSGSTWPLVIFTCSTTRCDGGWLSLAISIAKPHKAKVAKGSSISRSMRACHGPMSWGTDDQNLGSLDRCGRFEADPSIAAKACFTPKHAAPCGSTLPPTKSG